MTVETKHSKPFVPDDLQALKVENDALRALRDKSDEATEKVLDGMARRHTADLAKLMAEHEEDTKELKGRISLLSEHLSREKTANHADELEKAKQVIEELVAEAEENARIFASIKATLGGVINMHLGGE